MGKGVADLALLPMEQYRRDGRILRGLRKGTQSFLRTITIETLHTSHRVASFVSRTLDDIVTQPGAHASLRGLEYYDEQPTGVIDSLEHAYDAFAKEMQVGKRRSRLMEIHGLSYYWLQLHESAACLSMSTRNIAFFASFSRGVWAL